MARRYADQGEALIRGYQAGAQAVRDWQADQKKRDIEAESAKIMDGKLESDTGFTEEQGGVLEAATKAGNVVKFDEKKGAYVVANPAGEPLTVAPVARHQFLGKNYDTAPTEDQQDSARMRALSGIHIKNGNAAEGLRLRQQAIQNEQLAKQGVLTDLQIKGANRADDAAQREEKYQLGIPDLMKTSRYAERQADGGNYGIGDSLADSAKFLGYKAQHGKFDPVEWQGLAAKMKMVEDEGFVKGLRQAEAGAPLAEVIGTFNKSGEKKIDPKSVTGDAMGTVMLRGEAVPTRIITYTDAAGNTKTINVTAELSGLGETKDLLATHFAGKKDKREDKEVGLKEKEVGIKGGMLGVAQAAEKRVGGTAEAAATKEVEKSKAAVGIYQELNPNASPAHIKAVETGVISPVKVEPKDARVKVNDAVNQLALGYGAKLDPITKMIDDSKVKNPEGYRRDIAEAERRVLAGEPPMAVSRDLLEKASREDALKEAEKKGGKKAAGAKDMSSLWKGGAQ